MFQVSTQTPSGQSRAIPQPEPGLAAEQMIARAVALRPMVMEQATEAEALGGYTEALHREFIKAGFYRITTPRMFGGYEFDLATYFKVIIEISRGDPGTGWSLALGASHGWMVASHWPEEAQRLLFGDDGHFVCPARALDPTAAASPRRAAAFASRGNGIIAPARPTRHISSALREASTPRE